MPVQDTVTATAAFYPAMTAHSHVADTFTLEQPTDTFTVLRGSLRGETGHPLPYSLTSDHHLTTGLLVCFCLYLVIISHYTPFLVRQLKGFIFTTHTADTTSTTSAEVRMLIILSILNCAMLALSTFFFATNAFHLSLTTESPFLLVAVLTGLFMVFFLLKWGLYTLINNVFFGKKKNLQWLKSLLLLTACEGIFLFPAVIVQFYFDLSIIISSFFCIFILLLNKILTFYKAKQNFFVKNGGYLQTFLYFCALEIIPTLALGGVLQVSIDAFAIIF